jgi:hypothetical protein
MLRRSAQNTSIEKKVKPSHLESTTTFHSRSTLDMIDIAWKYKSKVDTTYHTLFKDNVSTAPNISAPPDGRCVIWCDHHQVGVA